MKKKSEPRYKLILMEAGNIPTGSIVTKEKGITKYRLLHDLKVFNTENIPIDFPIGTGLLDDQMNFRRIEPTTELWWHIPKEIWNLSQEDYDLIQAIKNNQQN